MFKADIRNVNMVQQYPSVVKPYVYKGIEPNYYLYQKDKAAKQNAAFGIITAGSKPYPYYYYDVEDPGIEILDFQDENGSGTGKGWDILGKGLDVLGGLITKKPTYTPPGGTNGAPLPPAPTAKVSNTAMWILAAGGTLAVGTLVYFVARKK